MRAMTEGMTTRLAAAWSALVLAVTALFTAGPALAADAVRPGATATGPDVAVSQAGNYPTQPNSYGNFSVQWTSVGTADATGITHLTVDLPPGLRTSGALMYSTPYDYTFSERVSPDGRHLEATFRGTRVPGRGDFMKVQVSSGAERPSGVIRATVANRDDVNPANNVSTYTVNGPQRPAEVPERPVVTTIDTVTGPGPAAPPSPSPGPVWTPVSSSSAARRPRTSAARPRDAPPPRRAVPAAFRSRS